MDSVAKIYNMNVNSDDKTSLFLSSFMDKKDAEIVSLFSAWMTHGWKQEDDEIQDFVKSTFTPTPTLYIENYPRSSYYKNGNFSFFKILTFPHLDMFLKKIHDIMDKYGDIENAFVKSKKTRDVYAHDTLSRMLGGNTGFQSKKTSGTFFRYNLFLYWMTYKLKVWTTPIENTLLPCNDFIFQKAYELGITNKIYKSNLSKTVILTNKAKEIFGEKDFYKLYEIINSQKQ